MYLQLTTEKNGAARIAGCLFVYPNPGTAPFHLTPRFDTAPQMLGTQPPGTRFIGSARVRGERKIPPKS